MARCIVDSSLGTPSDTYLYSLARVRNTFATIGSDDSLRLFDVSLKPLEKAIPVHTGISCLSTFGEGFATGGRDGLVRCWDARAKRTGIDVSEPRGNGFSSIACHDQFIAAGTESTKEGLGEVSVLLYDMRNPSIPVRNYAESHTDTITQLAFHPTQSNVLLSGSTDGLVSIFGISQNDEEDALQQVLNPRSAVHCAGFLAPTQVYVLTTDEHFSVYSLADTPGGDSRNAVEVGDVRERLHCMYAIDIVQGKHPMMAYGHNVNQTLSIVPLDPSRSYSFGPPIDLPGAHGEEVVRDLMLLDQEEKAVTCGEDGHVKVWDLDVTTAQAGDTMDID